MDPVFYEIRYCVTKILQRNVKMLKICSLVPMSPLSILIARLKGIREKHDIFYDAVSY